MFKSADTKDIIMSIKKRDIPSSGDASESTSETESENGGDLGEPRVIHLLLNSWQEVFSVDLNTSNLVLFFESFDKTTSL